MQLGLQAVNIYKNTISSQPLTVLCFLKLKVTTLSVLFYPRFGNQNKLNTLCVCIIGSMFSFKCNQNVLYNAPFQYLPFYKNVILF